eukprot:1137080-Lingulodinium_polyedra.AAC.1
MCRPCPRMWSAIFCHIKGGRSDGRPRELCRGSPVRIVPGSPRAKTALSQNVYGCRNGAPIVAET